MSGKSKPAAPKPAAASAPAGKPTGRPQGKSSPSLPAAGGAKKPGASTASATPVPASRGAKAEKDESADPFDIDNVAARNVPAVSPKAGKGRTIEVKCPMCDTAGFITDKQAGRDVKCCNPECMMPVFKAPPLARQDEGPAVEKGMFPATMTVAGIAVFGAIAAAVYFFVLKGPEEKPKEIVVAPTHVPTDEEKNRATTQIIPDAQVKIAEEKPPANLSELETTALRLIVEEGRSRDHTRNQAVTKQLAAEGLALRKNASGVRELLASLKSLGGNRGPYEVEPLVKLGWMELKDGKRDAAIATATSALKSAEQLPKVGRETIDAATSLAALLVALDRRDDAAKLIRDIPSDDRARASAIWMVSRETGTFQVGRVAAMSFLYGNPDVAASSAAFQAALRSGPAAVVPWAKSGTNAAVQDATLAACAAATGWKTPSKGETGVPAGLDAEFAAGTPATKIRMLAAVAEMDLLRGDKPAGLVSLSKAEALAAGIMPGTAMPIPGMKEIYNSEGKPFAGLPDPYPLFTTALALGDIADLQMRLDKKEAGWGTLQKGLAVLRSATPSVAAVQAEIDLIDKQPGDVQERLRTTLKLTNDRPKLFLAASRYRKQCEAVLGFAERRQEIAALLLERAAERGALEEVIALVVERQKATGNDRETYRQLPMAASLLAAAQAAGKSELESSLTNAGDKLEVPENISGLARAHAALQAGDAATAEENLRRVYNNARLERWLTDVAVMAAVTDKMDSAKAFDFAHRMRDPLVREDALRLLAARSIQQKSWEPIWKLMNDTTSLTHTDRAAILLGFLEAITAAG